MLEDGAADETDACARCPPGTTLETLGVDFKSSDSTKYLQRKLEIREKLEYEGGDSSAFAPLPDGDDDGDSDLARLS